MADKGNAFLTGAAGGMGTAIARALVAAGYRVVLADRDKAGLAPLAAELGNAAMPFVLDVTDPDRTARILELVPEDFQPIDVLINNAGHDIGGRKRFDVGSADDWAAIVDTNLNGLMRVTRAILPDMVRRNKGDIVNMSSIAALRIVQDMAPYNASKAGIHMLTEIIRAELAETAIRVTEMMPGLAKTGIILSRYRGDTTMEKAYFDQFKMALEPEDIARSIMFALEQPPHVQVAQMIVLPVNRW
ncbi:MAG: SDR family oxidoreductase [Pseudolabrys sp.]|jgi:3-hydroxy acid dehydrogenase/malonic semialdehyde reductase